MLEHPGLALLETTISEPAAEVDRGRLRKSAVARAIGGKAKGRGIRGSRVNEENDGGLLRF
jgi:hypothetical protein